MEYTDSSQDLFFPEASAPVFQEPEEPGDEELAIEAARLAYFRFENAEPRQVLERALRNVGFVEFEYFFGAVPGAASLKASGGGLDTLDLSKPAEAVATVAKQSLDAILSIQHGVENVLDDAAKAIHPGFTLFENPTDTQAFGAVRDDGLVLLAFRGSQATTVKDVLLDSQALQVTATGWDGLLHHGFSRAASAVWPKIESWLKKHPDSPLLLTGHSLGAAIATLISLRANRPNKTRLITLGSPRVGDPSFAASFKASKVLTTRMVDCSDIVTRVPLEKFGTIKYQHVGVPLYVARNGQTSDKPTKDNDTSSPLGLNAILAKLDLPFGLPVVLPVGLPTELTDHSAFNYLRAFRK